MENNYAKATLLVLNKPLDYGVRVQRFLMEEAHFIESLVYHYGNSTLTYRREVLDGEEVMVHLALDLVAADKRTLCQDLASITNEFPEFSLKPYAIPLPDLEISVQNS